MAFGKNKKPTTNDTEIEPKKHSEPLHWYGLQLQERTQGTGEIFFRSFPFWAHSVDWALTEARRQNKLRDGNKTKWTHLVIVSHAVEDTTSMKQMPLDQYEVKV